jgi:acyl-CoA synthetase (AMP-forming)/AMP-acid ligase II
MKNGIGGVGIVSGYGLTEAPILTMASVDDSDDKLANTEGQASPGVELKVVTIDGKVAGGGEEGEIRAKGPQVCLGYLDSSLDAEAFDDQGYFRTGDLGFVDAEGYVVITGRLKDVIIRKGENISAKEVEDLLYEHPKVSDVAVIGLSDPERGELVCAVVACVPDGEPLTMDELRRHLLDRQLITRKLPEQLEIVDELPRNPMGKVVKPQLRQQFA